VPGEPDTGPPPSRGPRSARASLRTAGSALAGPVLRASIARVELVSWAPLVVLTLAVGLAPVLIVGVSADAVEALAKAVAK